MHTHASPGRSQQQWHQWPLFGKCWMLGLEYSNDQTSFFRWCRPTSSKKIFEVGKSAPLSRSNWLSICYSLYRISPIFWYIQYFFRSNTIGMSDQTWHFGPSNCEMGLETILGNVFGWEIRAVRKIKIAVLSDRKISPVYIVLHSMDIWVRKCHISAESSTERWKTAKLIILENNTKKDLIE